MSCFLKCSQAGGGWLEKFFSVLIVVKSWDSHVFLLQFKVIHRLILLSCEEPMYLFSVISHKKLNDLLIAPAIISVCGVSFT